jgi:hypothetical protein
MKIQAMKKYFENIKNNSKFWNKYVYDELQQLFI